MQRNADLVDLEKIIMLKNTRTLAVRGLDTKKNEPNVYVLCITLVRGTVDDMSQMAQSSHKRSRHSVAKT